MLNGWIEKKEYLAFEHSRNTTESQSLLHFTPFVGPELSTVFIFQFASLAFFDGNLQNAVRDSQAEEKAKSKP